MLYNVTVIVTQLKIKMTYFNFIISATTIIHTLNLDSFFSSGALSS